jgi:UDP-3-O-[3-hydroxymyristoyl] N-acetylglucosamine deacetylase
MDGSAAPFMFLIECAGTIEQSAPRRAIRIREPVTVGNEHHRITIEPGNAQQGDFAIEFESAAIARQAHGITMESNVFRDEIARARTFGFAHEVAQLRANGLARGGSLENSVVVDGDRVLNEGGLRFKDEFVRHKILDCVGDLYLAGGPLLGRVRADRAGHRLNNLLLREVFARPAAWERVDLTEDMPAAVDQVRRRRPRLIAG